MWLTVSVGSARMTGMSVTSELKEVSECVASLFETVDARCSGNEA